MQVRHAEAERDAAACLDIYAPFVDDSPVSFEEQTPSLSDFTRRIERLTRTHAFLVADDDGRIAGYAYSGPHRDRPAYRWAAEATVYIHPEYHRRGIGRALYTPLFELLEQQGYRSVQAGVTVPNESSVGLHRACGFEDVGIYRRIGWKAGAWRDVLWMAKQLGPDTFESEPPPSPGAPARLAQPIEF
jgi:L-amino acid N-acyltransferase YncA